jgi:hypothetical protein
MTSKFVEGLGGPYFDKFIGFAPNYREVLSLDGYIKGSQSCPIGLGVGEMRKPSTSIITYPNPASESVNVRANEPLSYYDIFDFNGTCVQKGSLVNNTINIQALETGIYILSVYSFSRLKTSLKLVKQ